MRATSKEELSFQYFPFYVQAYLDSIAIGVLSMGAEACYHRLNARQWKAHTENGLLPVDPAHLRLLTKATPIEWRDIWPELEGLYPVTEDGRGRRNPELQALWLERVAYLEQQAANGRKGGRPKNPSESQQKATGSEKRGKEEPTIKPEKTHGFPVGSSWVSENAQNGNPTETSKLLVTPLSPPPSGGGASPATPPLRVLPGGKGNSNSAPAADPFAEGEAVSLDALLERVPFRNRGPVAELLTQHSRPAKWAGWIEKLETMTATSDIDGPPITWDHVAQGVSELLLINEPGRRITPSNVYEFVAAVPRRQLRASIPAAGGATPAIPSAGDPYLEYCVAQAKAGHEEYVAICHEHGIIVAQESA